MKIEAKNYSSDTPDDKFKRMTQQLKTFNTDEDVADYIRWIIMSQTAKEYWQEKLKNTAMLLLVLLLPFTSFAQVEIGYTTGVSKMGINPSTVQPIYGITLQRKFNKIVAIESNVFYSQRTLGNTIQADYITFMLTGKVGYVGEKAGAYIGYGASLNPTLHHSNPANHTYLSIDPCVGAQANVFLKTIVELKLIYSKDLTDGFYNGDKWNKYSGFILMGSLKFRVK